MKKKLLGSMLLVFFALSTFSSIAIQHQEAEAILGTSQHWYSQIARKQASSIEGDASAIIAYNSTLIWVAHEKVTAGNCNGIFMERSTNGGESWTEFTIDSGALRGCEMDISLIGDGGFTSGGVYVAYSINGAGDAGFAKSTDGGSTWATTTIETTNSVGTDISIDALSTSTIVVAYRDATNSALRFAKSTNGGTTWTPSAVEDTANTVGFRTSIFMRDSSVIYIAYTDATPRDLKLATSTDGGSNWTLQTVVSTNLIDAPQSLDVILGASASADVLMIAYTDATLGSTRFIKSTDGGASWDLPVTVSGVTGIMTTVDAVSTSIIYVAIDRGFSGTLRLGISSAGGSSWSVQDIDNTDGLAVTAGTDTMMQALDANTVFMVSGTNDAGTGRANLYFYKPDLVTTVSTIDSARAGTSISLSNAGTSFVVAAYYATSGGDLYFAKSTNGGTTWNTPTAIDTAGDVGVSPTIQAINSTLIYIVYQENTSGTADTKFIRSTNGGTSWDTPVIIDTSSYGATSGQSTSASMKAMNATHIYVAYQDSTGTALAFAKSTDGGTNWSTAVIKDSASVNEGGDVSIDAVRVGANDHIHISYLDGTASNMRYMRSQNSGSTFPTDLLVDAAGSTDVQNSSIVAVDENNIFFVYGKNLVSGDVRFAKSTNGGTSFVVTTLVSAFGSSAYPSITASSASKLFVTYHVGDSDNSAENLAYSTDGGSNWSFRVVDGTFNAGFYGGPKRIVAISDLKLYIGYNAFGRNNAKFAFTNLGSTSLSSPSITSSADTPDPVRVGSQISFVMNWEDADDTSIKAHVCKTDFVSASTSGGSCTGGTWVSGSSFTTSNPVVLTYTALIGDLGTNNYYLFVCDDDVNCSPDPSGTFTVLDAPVEGDGTSTVQASIFDEFANSTPLLGNYTLEVWHTNGIKYDSCDNCAGFDVDLNNTSIERVIVIRNLGTTFEYRREQINNEGVEDQIMSFFMVEQKTGDILTDINKRTITTYAIGIEDLSSQFSNPIIRIKKQADNATSTIVIDEHQPNLKNEIETHLVPEEVYIIEAENSLGEIRNIGEYQASVFSTRQVFTIRLFQMIGDINTYQNVTVSSAWHSGTLIYYGYQDFSEQTIQVNIFLEGSDGTVTFIDRFTSQKFTGQFNNANASLYYNVRFVVEHEKFGTLSYAIPASKTLRVGEIQEQGLVFNGSYAADTSNTAADFTQSTPFSFRVRLSTVSSTSSVILSKGNSTYGYQLLFNINGTVTFQVNGTGNFVTSTSSINDGVIHDITVGFKNGTNTATLYRDGSQQASKNFTGTFTSLGKALAFAADSSGASKLNGTLYRVDIWGRTVESVVPLGLFRHAILATDYPSLLFSHEFREPNIKAVNNELFVKDNVSLEHPTKIFGLTQTTARFTTGTVTFTPQIQFVPSYILGLRLFEIPFIIYVMVGISSIFTAKDAPEIGAAVMGMITFFFWWNGMLTGFENTTQFDILIPFVATMGFVTVFLYKKFKGQ